MTPRSRYAPAPTGYLHLGHVLNAIYVWGVVRSRGGVVLLRIEDHDRRRSREAYEASILDDLDWLGFVPDEFTTDEFRAGSCVSRQSDREPVYRSVLNRLRSKGLVYACECSRSDIAASTSREGEELWYPGTCREKRLEERAGLGIRVRLDSSTEPFVDLLRGPQVQQPFSQCGDMLVRDRDGDWTYQFAVTVDDDEQDVTLVIRGEDLLASTGRQIQLARLIGRDVPPQYLHHPLIMKSPGQKLSKSDGDTAIRDLRARGWRAVDVIGEAAFQGGLIERPRPLTTVESGAIAARQT